MTCWMSWLWIGLRSRFLKWSWKLYLSFNNLKILSLPSECYLTYVPRPTTVSLPRIWNWFNTFWSFLQIMISSSYWNKYDRAPKKTLARLYPRKTLQISSIRQHFSQDLFFISQQLKGNVKKVYETWRW